MENKTFPGLVGLFGNTVTTTGFKVHASSCSMVNTAIGLKRKVVKCEVDAFTLVDMQERQYKVTFCKCVSKEDKAAALQAAKDHGPTGQS